MALFHLCILIYSKVYMLPIYLVVKYATKTYNLVIITSNICWQFLTDLWHTSFGSVSIIFIKECHSWIIMKCKMYHPYSLSVITSESPMFSYCFTAFLWEQRATGEGSVSCCFDKHEFRALLMTKRKLLQSVMHITECNADMQRICLWWIWVAYRYPGSQRS